MSSHASYARHPLRSSSLGAAALARVAREALANSVLGITLSTSTAHTSRGGSLATERVTTRWAKDLITRRSGKSNVALAAEHAVRIPGCVVLGTKVVVASLAVGVELRLDLRVLVAARVLEGKRLQWLCHPALVAVTLIRDRILACRPHEAGLALALSVLALAQSPAGALENLVVIIVALGGSGKGTVARARAYIFTTEDREKRWERG